MPCTPISARRSLTSSSLNGLMMASTFFISRSLGHTMFRARFASAKCGSCRAEPSSLPHARAKLVEPVTCLAAPCVVLADVLDVHGEISPLLLESRAILRLVLVVVAADLLELLGEL